MTQSLLIDRVVESDHAQPVGHVISFARNQDTARILARQKRRTITQVREDDTAQMTPRSHRRQITGVTENVLVSTPGRQHSRLLPRGLEQDHAEINLRGTRQATQIHEGDLAQLLRAQRWKRIEQVLERDVARIVDPVEFSREDMSLLVVPARSGWAAPRAPSSGWSSEALDPGWKAAKTTVRSPRAPRQY